MKKIVDVSHVEETFALIAKYPVLGKQIPHIYKSITGWMTFEGFYRDMVQKFPSGSKFVEVGTYSGQSIAYLLVEAINQNKKFEVTAVDSFTFVDEKTHENILDALVRNLDVLDYEIDIIKEQSWAAADMFEDGSVDFCFLDADHLRPALEKDIDSWLPKMKRGSQAILAGHDVCIEPYWPNDHPDVLKVINEKFGDKWKRDYVEEKVWYVIIE